MKVNNIGMEQSKIIDTTETYQGEKMELELHGADVIDDHKIKMEKMRLKIRRLENMPLIVRLGIIMLLDQLLP